MSDSANKMPALVVATLASFLTPFTVSSITVALPSIGKDFAIDALTLVGSAAVCLGRIPHGIAGAECAGLPRECAVSLFEYRGAD
jgi:hypothetical protein